MKCPMCKDGVMEDIIRDEQMEVEDDVILVTDVPVSKCNQCGEVSSGYQAAMVRSAAASKHARQNAVWLLVMWRKGLIHAITCAVYEDYEAAIRDKSKLKKAHPENRYSVRPSHLIRKE